MPNIKGARRGLSIGRCQSCDKCGLNPPCAIYGYKSKRPGLRGRSGTPLRVSGGRWHGAPHRSEAANEHFACARQCHPELVALEQHQAEFLLQFLDTPGDRRLRQPEMPGARAQAAAFDHRNHISEMMQLHGRSVRVSRPRISVPGLSLAYTLLVTSSCKSHLLATPYRG